MAAWLGEFQCMGFDSSVCELMKETSSFCIYMVIESGSMKYIASYGTQKGRVTFGPDIMIYGKGDVFLVKKLGILLMMVMLVAIAVGSQMLGEHLYAQVEETTETAGKVESQVMVILDSGHGGSDPGKIGVNDALEKDINLCIAEKVKSNLEAQGISVKMTREDGNGLADSKVEDLKARVSLINDNKPVLAVSIHQNSYPQESIHGAQVFYYAHSKNGEEAAKLLQESLLEVDPDNTRQAKSNDTYYLLKKTKVATVIVECGFLSNQGEAEKLVTEEYQEKVAEAVAKGIQRYVGNV